MMFGLYVSDLCLFCCDFSLLMYWCLIVFVLMLFGVLFYV